MKRPYTKEEKALLDEMSRSTDPRQEAQRLLEYELEHGSPITRRAFIAELLRARRYIDLTRAARTRLPVRIREELDRTTKAKNFEHLVALAEAKGDAPPDAEILTLERTPGSEG
jgi:hypothetical protein